MYQLRIPDGLIDLTDMGMTDMDPNYPFRAPTLDILPDVDGNKPPPRTQFKGRGLSTLNLRGEIWPVGESSRMQWVTLIEYLNSANDPAVTLERVEGDTQSTVGVYYVTDASETNPNIVNGVMKQTRWRLTLQEYAEGEPITQSQDEPEAGDDLPRELE